MSNEKNRIQTLEFRLRELESCLDLLVVRQGGKLYPSSGARHSASGHTAYGVCIDGLTSVPRLYDDWNTDRKFLGFTHVPHLLRLSSPVVRSSCEQNDAILQTLADNPHPNISRVVSFNHRSIIVEYIDGLLLSNKRRFAPSHWTKCYLDHPEAKIDFSAITHAISHLHELGLAYTDLSSYNILVRKGEYSIPILVDLCSITPITEELRDFDLKALDNLQTELKTDFPGQVL